VCTRSNRSLRRARLRKSSRWTRLRPRGANSPAHAKIADVRGVLEDGGRTAKQVRIENKVYVDLDAVRGNGPDAHAEAERVDRQATAGRSRDLVPAVPNPTPLAHSTEVPESPSGADRAARGRASAGLWIAAAAIALMLGIVLVGHQLAAIRGDTGRAAFRNAKPDRGVVVSDTQVMPLSEPTSRVSSTVPPSCSPLAHVASGGGDGVTREESRLAQPAVSTRAAAVAPAPAAPSVVARTAPHSIDFLDRVDQLDPAGSQEAQRGQTAKSSAPKQDGSTGEFRTSF